MSKKYNLIQFTFSMYHAFVDKCRMLNVRIWKNSNKTEKAEKVNCQ